MMAAHNPLVGSTPAETADYVVEAMGALMGLLADANSGLFRLLSPIEDAMRHQAEALRRVDLVIRGDSHDRD